MTGEQATEGPEPNNKPFDETRELIIHITGDESFLKMWVEQYRQSLCEWSEGYVQENDLPSGIEIVIRPQRLTIL